LQRFAAIPEFIRDLRQLAVADKKEHQSCEAEAAINN